MMNRQTLFFSFLITISCINTLVYAEEVNKQKTWSEWGKENTIKLGGISAGFIIGIASGNYIGCKMGNKNDSYGVSLVKAIGFTLVGAAVGTGAGKLVGDKIVERCYPEEKQTKNPSP